MKSNYKPVGEYIREVKDRNFDGNINTLLGINIDKYFMPSVANVVGTDLTVYKIVKKGRFACNRMHVGRDKRLPVALSKSDTDFIVSPAYDVFEILDESILNPEYLMMWFSRKEFDRNAWFYTDADVRGGLSRDAFCNMQLPVPAIEKQKEIVKEYSTIVNRIKLNEQLNRKLEETAQAIYRQWFVDFEFPDENGNPYKSSGGEMAYNAELDKEIPKGWEVSSLSNVANYLNGIALQNYDTFSNDYLSVIKIRELSQGFSDEKSGRSLSTIPKQYIVNDGDVIFSWSGTLLVEFWCGGVGALNQHLFKVTSNNFKKWYYYLWTKYHLQEFIRFAEGRKTSMGHIKRENLDMAKVLIPKTNELINMDKIFEPIIKRLMQGKKEEIILNKFNNLLLSKMTSFSN